MPALPTDGARPCQIQAAIVNGVILGSVQEAYLEADGTISVLTKKEARGISTGTTSPIKETNVDH